MFLILTTANKRFSAHRSTSCRPCLLVLECQCARMTVMPATGLSVDSSTDDDITKGGLQWLLQT
jgi:hypothetical protein